MIEQNLTIDSDGVSFLKVSLLLLLKCHFPMIIISVLENMRENHGKIEF